jgi:5-methylcytosine-specific restriction endonuclease McrA
MGNFKKFGWLPAYEVLPYVLEPNQKGPVHRDFTVNGCTYSINMTATRYRVFQKSHFCVCCGLEGRVMVLGMNGRRFIKKNAYFNLYSENDVLMTKDHIIPRSQGGPDNISNLQTMCSICNCLKGDRIISVEELRNENRLLLGHSRTIAKSCAL